MERHSRLVRAMRMGSGSGIQKHLETVRPTVRDLEIPMLKGSSLETRKQMG
jgi:hypothetical protein